MKRIKFVKDYQVQAVDGSVYGVGDVVQLNERSANHFISRQVAVEVEVEKEAPDVAAVKVDADGNDYLTVKEIKAALDEAGIEYKVRMSRDELLALLPEECK